MFLFAKKKLTLNDNQGNNGLWKILLLFTACNDCHLESITANNLVRWFAGLPCKEDVIAPSLDRDEVLSQAPTAESGRFRVPPTIGFDV
jgi:Asp-tRNA(Asn)/Glu-tRNA(Gln) amidotransferase C subunit